MPNLLVMAWAEAADESKNENGSSSNLLTKDLFIELTHAQMATAMEKYGMEVFAE